VVDINAGCPVPKVIKGGAGAALARQPEVLAAAVRAVRKASDEALGAVPVTVKIRSGWDAGSINYLEAAEAAIEAGAAMVTLHPRTRAQGYSGVSDWDCLARLTAAVNGRCVVCGSGDLYTPEDAERMLRGTGCDAVMFARGAEGNPFIFRETREYLTTGEYALPTAAERMAAGLRHLEMLAGDIGEHAACREMRKQFCAYTKALSGQQGAPGGHRLRDALVHAQSVAEYREIVGGVLPA
jgi:nifR3 family TIM-barrel protein